MELPTNAPVRVCNAADLPFGCQNWQMCNHLENTKARVGNVRELARDRQKTNTFLCAVSARAEGAGRQVY